MYKTAFETPYTDAIGEYYEQESSKVLREQGCSKYLSQAVKWINDESLMNTSCFYYETASLMQDILVKCLVLDHLQAFMTHCPAMLAEEDEISLKSMYYLITREKVAHENGLDTLAEKL